VPESKLFFGVAYHWALCEFKGTHADHFFQIFFWDVTVVKKAFLCDYIFKVTPGVVTIG
jgi:hypothetical protein